MVMAAGDQLLCGGRYKLKGPRRESDPAVIGEAEREGPEGIAEPDDGADGAPAVVVHVLNLPVHDQSPGNR